MSKEYVMQLEATIANFKRDNDILKNKVANLEERLDSIKNTDSDVALENLDKMYRMCTPQHYYQELDKCRDTIQGALLELKKIKNINLSEPLKCLKRLREDITVYNDYRQDFKDLAIIEDYILKIQEVLKHD